MIVFDKPGAKKMLKSITTKVDCKFYCNSRALEREPGLHCVLTQIAHKLP